MALFIVLLSIGCSSTSMPPEDASERNKANRYITTNEYRIGIDDVVRINVWGNEELSVEVPVRPDGMISMPLIGDVTAGGRTPDEVSRDIKNRLTAYIRNPNVTVMLTELNSHQYLSRIRVTGAIRTPLSLPYRQGMTVLDAVLEAGGPNEYASANSTKIYRKTNKETIILDVELGGIINKGELKTNYMLMPGDIVTVPERLF